MALIPMIQRLIDRAIGAGVETEVGDFRTCGLFLGVHASERWTWNFRRTISRRDLGDERMLDKAQALVAELNVNAFRRWADGIVEALRLADRLVHKPAARAGERYVPPPPVAEPETGTTWRDAFARPLATDANP